MRPHAVHAVIAVKSLDRAKSRLAEHLRPPQRARLVLAMLADTVRAAAAVPAIASVTVVTPDPLVAELARSRGAMVHPEPVAQRSHSDPDKLNTALDSAAAALRRRHGPVDLLALQADLPALRPDELAAMFTAAPPATRSLVVDHAGSGTAALLAPAGIALRPRFGPGSARRHIGDGAAALGGDWPGLRLDVDTAADLDRALLLGAGTDTRALLCDIGWPHSVHQPVPRVC
ncbi:2-phospho-L-lactate guanylyltransferase [Nocardia donostiensis]|uniref:Phosphoenolpyruvate guanylyltransferase n=1 Tax=Nocardia donostiensis TaxID=1538463 RepID=A0A1V2TIF0_9NOCA|nr:2-phospho-L-lactate guanylyltransferase [Nocardia donostiensis]ONM49310.1 2-phospho-L-lactate guanylyltransferase [Nocardia donostiensis]OQS14830.1 2-phospho-L-lactate guanylyltransferase [Nocardia donostiensis]OQS21833.1 2-phospho-L-lactate guanylyltransferase [Nocardia donostiensis]